MQEITDIENCIHNKVKILCTKIDSLTAENKAQESAHREEIFKLNDKCVVMCRAKQEEIDRLTARNKELNFCIENLIKRREEFDKNVAKLTTENKKLNQILDERAAKGMEAMGFERAELRQDAGTEFTKNWKEKRQLFADLKPVGDELDYMQVVCKHIHELLMMGDKACKIIDRLTIEIEAKNEALQEIKNWCEAYPLEIFPKPSKDDFKKAYEVLKTNGLSLDRISTDNMRHVLNGVKGIVESGLCRKRK